MSHLTNRSSLCFSAPIFNLGHKWGMHLLAISNLARINVVGHVTFADHPLCQLFNCFMTIRDTFNKILMQTAALAEKLTDLRHWHKR